MTTNKEDITDKFLYSLCLKVFNLENHSCKMKQSHLRMFAERKRTCMWEKQLAVKPPYHFDQVLRRLSSDPLKAVDLSQREIKVPIRLEQNRTWSSFATGTKDAPMFRVRANGPEEPLLSEVKRIFGMEHQLHMIQDHFSQTNLASILSSISERRSCWIFIYIIV